MNNFRIVASPQEGEPPRLNAINLGIPKDNVELFLAKKRMTYEALLFVTVHMATLEQSEVLQKEHGDTAIHPLAMEMTLLIQGVWLEHGVAVGLAEVGERCFDEVGVFLAKPVEWAADWLSEFLDDEGAVRRLSPAWADQWQVDFDVMGTVVRESA